MELTKESQKEYKVGAQNITLNTGMTLKIETSPAGEEVLVFVADKDYLVNLTVHATTSDE